MKYTFRPLPELYWGVVVAASLVLLQALFTLQPEQITDWQIWAVALLGGALRAAAGAALDYIRRSIDHEPEPTLADQIMQLSPAERKFLQAEIESRAGVPHG